MPARRHTVNYSVTVPVIINPLSDETEEKLRANPELQRLRRIIESQARIIGEGATDDTTLKEVGKLFAERYREINEILIPDVGLPLFQALLDLFATYDDEVGMRTAMHRNTKMMEYLLEAMLDVAYDVLLQRKRGREKSKT